MALYYVKGKCEPHDGRALGRDRRGKKTEEECTRCGRRKCKGMHGVWKEKM